MLGTPTIGRVGVTGLDHVVLTVSDVERAVAWYRDELLLEPVRLQEWRRGAVPFPSVRVDPDTIIDLLAGERTGQNMNHLCLVVDRPFFEEVLGAGRLPVVEGPGKRFGAKGQGTSLYVHDPDGNLVELRHYD